MSGKQIFAKQLATWLVLSATACTPPAERPEVLAPRPKELPAAPAVAPSQSPTPPAESGVEDRLDPVEPRSAAFSAVVPALAGVAPAPPYCPQAGPLPVTAGECSTRDQLLDRLDSALRKASASSEPADEVACHSDWSNEQRAAKRRSARRQATPEERGQRDRAFSEIEACAGGYAALVRVLRAHERPECAESLAVLEGAAVVTGSRERTAHHADDPATRVALAGLAVAAQIDRIPMESVTIRWSERDDAAAAQRRMAQALEPIVERRLAFLREAARVVATLPEGTYGRSVAELALARVWSRPLGDSGSSLGALAFPARKAAEQERDRLVERIRATAAPHEENAEKSALVATDWDLLEPWSQHHRGWAERLRSLVVPLPKTTNEDSVVARLAERLPSWVSARLLGPYELTPPVVVALLRRGFDPSLRRRLSHTSSSDVQVLAARGRLRLAVLSLQLEQARTAYAALAAPPPEQVPRDLLALARLLAPAPSGSAAWSTSAPPELDLESARAAAFDRARPLEEQWVLLYATLLFTPHDSSRKAELDQRLAELRARVGPSLAACGRAFGAWFSPSACTCPSLITE